MTLEDYLADQYNRDKQEVAAIEQVLADVAAMFAASIDPENDFWPYELRAGDKVTAGKPSQGTSAMILAASGKMLGACTLRDRPTSERLLDSPKALKCAFDKGLTALSNKLRKDGKVRSGTFCDNDPLTIQPLD